MEINLDGLYNIARERYENLKNEKYLCAIINTGEEYKVFFGNEEKEIDKKKIEEILGKTKYEPIKLGEMEAYVLPRKELESYLTPKRKRLQGIYEPILGPIVNCGRCLYRSIKNGLKSIFLALRGAYGRK